MLPLHPSSTRRMCAFWGPMPRSMTVRPVALSVDRVIVLPESVSSEGHAPQVWRQYPSLWKSGEAHFSQAFSCSHVLPPGCLSSQSEFSKSTLSPRKWYLTISPRLGSSRSSSTVRPISAAACSQASLVGAMMEDVWARVVRVSQTAGPARQTASRKVVSPSRCARSARVLSPSRLQCGVQDQGSCKISPPRPTASGHWISRHWR
mmetsp:Transcript_32304/g.69606  ORF Transcript_32304/g.69606 Transcript_32304/m.69606 type:complete len:205 (-) Transcript_32304:754-1368(-)